MGFLYLMGPLIWSQFYGLLSSAWTLFQVCRWLCPVPFLLLLCPILEWTPCMQPFQLVCRRCSWASWHRWFLTIMKVVLISRLLFCSVTCPDFQIRNVCKNLLVCLLLISWGTIMFFSGKDFPSALASPFEMWGVLDTCASCPLV